MSIIVFHDARAHRSYSRIVVPRIMSRDNKGNLVSSSAHHNAVKERAASIIAQVDCEMARIKEHDHHWKDGIEVRLSFTTSP